MGPDTDPAPSNTASSEQTNSSEQAPSLPQVPVRVALGQVVMTPGVRDNIPVPEFMAALARHARGDWGTVSPGGLEGERPLAARGISDLVGL